MKIAIMQPYFLPYIGYWQLINSVDTFVIYDDVNFIKGGWINRNRLLENTVAKPFTIPLKEVSQNRNIHEIQIDSDIKKMEKFKKRIQYNYAKAPFFTEVYALIEKFLSHDCKSIVELNQFSITTICDYLGMNTQILRSSELEKNNDLKGQEKIIHICNLLGANTYINPIGGQDLYNMQDFAANNIKLEFLKTNDIEYNQFNHQHVPNLSIMDALMFNNVKRIQSMLLDYTLI